MSRPYYEFGSWENTRLVENAIRSLIKDFECRVGEGEDGGGCLPIMDVVNSHNTNLRPIELSMRQMQLILFCLDRAMANLPD